MMRNAAKPSTASCFSYEDLKCAAAFKDNFKTNHAGATGNVIQ